MGLAQPLQGSDKDFPSKEKQKVFNCSSNTYLKTACRLSLGSFAVQAGGIKTSISLNRHWQISIAILLERKYYSTCP